MLIYAYTTAQKFVKINQFKAFERSLLCLQSIYLIKNTLKTAKYYYNLK